MEHLHKNVKYDALWQMNLMNGLRIVWPSDECGAMMYEKENSGNMMPAKNGRTNRKGKCVRTPNTGWE